jgi:uncharacterized membrane protein
MGEFWSAFLFSAAISIIMVGGFQVESLIAIITTVATYKLMKFVELV